MGGNVGIGTTNPNNNLTIQSRNDNSSSFKMTNDSIANFEIIAGELETHILYNNEGYQKLRFSGDEYGTDNALVLSSNSYIGIGTANPLVKLHLAGDGAILATGTAGSGWNGGSLGAGSRMMWIPSKGAFRAGYAISNYWDSTNIGKYSASFGTNNLSSGEYSFSAGKYNAVVSTGSVALGYNNTIMNGEGTVALGYNNLVSSTLSGSFSVGYGNIVFSTGSSKIVGAIGYSNTVEGDGGSIAIGNHSEIYGESSFAFGTDFNGSYPLIINSANSFAFGQHVALNSAANSSMGINMKGVTNSGKLTISSNNSVGIKLGSNTNHTISSPNIFAILDGDVGIGDANPTYLLDVYRSADSGITARIRDSDGSCTLNPGAGASWSCSSDERLKRNILDINKGLNEILSIRPVNYYWKNAPEDSLYKMGFVAQELKEIIPEAVFLEEDSGYYSISESVLIPILVKAVQEQQAEIEALREAVSTTLSVQQSGGQLTYSGGDLDLQNYALLNVKNIVGTDNKWAIDENGQFITRIQTSGGNTKEMFAMQSPYSEFVFSSSSELINGEAIINFDSDTCELIDETQPLKVNITLTGECGGIFVKEKSATGFVVKELNGGTSTSTFDWMVIAKRKFAKTSPQSSPSQGEEGVPSPLEGEGDDEVEIPSTLEGEGEAEPLTETGDGGEVVTTTPEIPPEPPIEESTTTPEVLPEPPIEEPPAEAEPLTEQSSGDGEETPPVEETL
jgi:hypothetical protein